jgi:hypothetical protein
VPATKLLKSLLERLGFHREIKSAFAPQAMRQGERQGREEIAPVDPRLHVLVGEPLDRLALPGDRVAALRGSEVEE